MKTESWVIADEAAMVCLGESLAERLSEGQLVCVSGDLGAGKTTLIRGILAGLGHVGDVPSPTYTLVEPYSLASMEVAHMDLYRLSSSEELEMIGFRDLIESSLCLVEWPEKGLGFMPKGDWRIEIQHNDNGRIVTICR